MIKCYYDGELTTIDKVHISPLDFGFIHSDATYDVMRGVTFFERHWERFTNSCEYYGFVLPDKSDTLAKIENLIEGDMFVWLAMWRGTPPSGSPRDLSAPQHFLIYTKPYYGICQQPITLKLYEDIPRSPGYQTYKNFSWIELTKAQAASTGYDSAILRNINGYINEGPGFGVCFVTQGVVITPKTDVLRSVTIDVVEDICKDMDIPFIRLDFSNYDFDECFIASTSGGVTPVAQLNEHKYLHIITKQIQERYNDLYRYG